VKDIELLLSDILPCVVYC